MKSWNEIRKAATAFSKRWKNAYDEKAQAQSFLKEFFAVFGVDTVVFNAFEHRVKFSDGSQGYADCFWQGKILVEMKSRGKDLDNAYSQAMDYVRTLLPSDYPHAVVVSDFQSFRFYNLEKDNALTAFALKDLRKYVTLFGFMIGAEDGGEIREQDPVNRKAAEKMARLHDAMKAVGYTGHPLEVYLVRLLFCLFAEDTGIFKPNQFSLFVERKTAGDGSDLAARLAELFGTLNAPPGRRLSILDETVAAFPYVNGGLFAETLPIAAFSAEMRKALLECGALDWAKISPAIFGAMFQGVMDEKARHDLGAHYTSEMNILKLIRPLFLDALRAEFTAICALNGNAKTVRLRAFHEKIAALTFLDPACGCGNFLLIAYRELRRIEMDVLEELYRDEPNRVLDISELCKVSVSQFYGIEIEPFPAEIAKVALWLMDHLCNMEVADRFGQYFARIPIKDSPHVVCANALTTDWPCTDYIFGNPPFNGARTIHHNADGGLSSDGIWSYAYDAEDQLRSVTSRSLTNGAIRARNTYDHRRRRISKTVQRLNVTTASPPAPPVELREWETCEERTFVYDDWNLIHETIYTIEGGVTNTSEVQYFWGLDLSNSRQGAGGVGGLLAVSRNGQLYFPTFDNNGNVTKYIDESGNIAAAYEYDDFGRIISQSGPLADFFRHRFSTKYYDSETGLYYYGYRFYALDWRLWLNRDPFEEEGGFNLYSFCENRLSRIDYLGLYVNVVYDVANKTLTATDVDSGTSITLKEKVYSGNGKSCCVKDDQWKSGKGPLPTGKYLIGLSYVPSQHSSDTGDYNWYRLYGSNGKGGYTYNKIPVKTPTGTTVYRGGFNLHTGRMSDGCVTVWSDVSQGDTGYPHSDDYDKLKAILDKTKPLRYKHSNYSGWLEVK